jgi:ADP-L-glycero-D-manno-heptose 6-epimerase
MRPLLLITGAAGFVGAHCVRIARARGYDVLSCDLPELFGTRPEHADLDFGRILPRDECVAWLEREKPKLRGVIHMGACTDTTEFDPKVHEKLNVRASQALWNWCTLEGVPLVYASSAATYGAGERGYDDDERRMAELQPLNPYGESKLRFDLWALAEENAGRKPPTWSGFKFFNVYGFGERHKGKMASVVLHAFDQILRSGSMKLFKSHHPQYRDGEQMRDFVLVDDVVDVLFFALEKPIARGIFNLGSGQARTWLDLVRGVFRALDKPERIEFIDTPEELRARYQYFTEAAMEKLRAEGYTKAFTPLEKGVAATVARLRSQLSH